MHRTWDASTECTFHIQYVNLVRNIIHNIAQLDLQASKSRYPNIRIENGTITCLQQLTIDTAHFKKDSTELYDASFRLQKENGIVKKEVNYLCFYSK